MNNLIQDIRFGLRMLLKSPSVSIVATIALALGMLGFRTDYDQSGQLPKGTESAQGVEMQLNEATAQAEAARADAERLADVASQAAEQSTACLGCTKRMRFWSPASVALI